MFLSDLENRSVVLQNLLLHLHQLRHSLMEGEELGRHLLLLGMEVKDETNM